MNALNPPETLVLGYIAIALAISAGNVLCIFVRSKPQSLRHYTVLAILMICWGKWAPWTREENAILGMAIIGATGLLALLIHPIRTFLAWISRFAHTTNSSEAR